MAHTSERLVTLLKQLKGVDIMPVMFRLLAKGIRYLFNGSQMNQTVLLRMGGQIFIKIEADHNGIISVNPQEAVVSGVIPNDVPCDVHKEICDLGYFYSSEAATSEWLTQHPEERFVNLKPPGRLLKRWGGQL